MIRKKRFQNHIAESRWLLPSTLLVYTVMWWLLHPLTVQNGVSFLCCMLTVYILSLWTTRFSLLRTYSKMIPASLVVFTLLAGNAAVSCIPFVSQMLTATCMYSLIRAYRNYTPEGTVFKAFLCLSLTTLGNVWLVLLIPLLWHIMFHQLQCFTIRTLLASVLGLLLPYWLLLGIVCLVGQEALLDVLELPALYDVKHYGILSLLSAGSISDINFGYVWAADFSALSWQSAIVPAFMIFSLIIAAIHYIRQGFSDRTFTRQLYAIFIVACVLFLCGMLVLCNLHRHFALLLSVFLSPLVAHLFTHTYTRWTNRLFKFWLILLVAILTHSVWNSF